MSALLLSSVARDLGVSDQAISRRKLAQEQQLPGRYKPAHSGIRFLALALERQLRLGQQPVKQPGSVKETVPLCL